MSEAADAMNTLIEEVAEAMEWSTKETRNFLRCFRSDSPENLREDLMAACQWAQEIEARAALVSLMKGEANGFLEAKWDRQNKDVALGINRDSKDDQD